MMSFLTFSWDFWGAKGCDIDGESLNRSSIPDAGWDLFSTGSEVGAVLFFCASAVASAAAIS